MAKNDLEKESNNLSIIVVLALFLICSLGYIAYDKYFYKMFEGEPVDNCVDKEVKEQSTFYKEDSIFVKNLMDKVVLKTGIDHEEFQLYAKEKVTVDDLTSDYKNNLIGYNMKGSKTVSNFDLTSKELFGKNIYDTMPEVIHMNCEEYKLMDDYYVKQPQVGGCGGTGYRYYDIIDRVEQTKGTVYVFQRVGFQCNEGVCKNVVKENTRYAGKDVVKKLDNPMQEVNLNDLKKELNEYKFTFKLDKNNNIYYFESVELVK